MDFDSVTATPLRPPPPNRVAAEAELLERAAAAFRIAQCETVSVLMSEYGVPEEEARSTALAFARETGDWLLLVASNRVEVPRWVLDDLRVRLREAGDQK